MSRCNTCENEYERGIEVTMEGETHTFDCFECAIHKLAPACEACGCRIIGHGVRVEGSLFCCAHCARREGSRTAEIHA